MELVSENFLPTNTEIALPEHAEVFVPEVQVNYKREGGIKFEGKMSNSNNVADFLRSIIPEGELEFQEQAIVLYLDQSNKIIGYYRHSKGGISQTVMDTRIILSVALKAAAVGIILCHNHPSGNTMASNEDIAFTKRFKEACRVMSITLLDHIIITKTGYNSFADEGLMGLSGKAKNITTMMKDKEKITEADAREAAKSLIRVYVHRGDRPEGLKKSHLGSYNSKYHATILGGKIVVSKVKEEKVHFSFPFDSIYNEVLDEKAPIQPVSKAELARAVQSHNERKPVRIDYSESHPVERIEEEIKFIKRFLGLHNRKKTKQQILSFLNALQRAIIEKRIRKTSRYAKQIGQIQNQLVAAYKAMPMEIRFEIGKKSLKEFSEIAGSEKIRFSTTYLKRFIGIQGKNIDKPKAQKLLDLITGAIKRSKITKADPYYDRIVSVSNSLKRFINEAKKGDTLELHRAILNGLDGVLGCACGGEDEEERMSLIQGFDGLPEAIPTTDKPEVMSADEIRNKKYQPANISGRWLDLIGPFCLPTQFFVHGIGGSGKTSFVLLFAQYLASLGYRILYVAGEQYDTPTFTALLNRLNIRVDDKLMEFVPAIDTLNPADFDFVVLDSKDHLEINVDGFIDLMERYPKQSFIVLSQSVKSGNFTGRERWRNTVDVMIQADRGVVRTGHDKNRWGGAGEMRIFGQPSEYRNAA